MINMDILSIALLLALALFNKDRALVSNYQHLRKWIFILPPRFDLENNETNYFLALANETLLNLSMNFQPQMVVSLRKAEAACRSCHARIYETKYSDSAENKG